MKMYNFPSKSKHTNYRYEIHVISIDGVVIQWAEEKEALYKVGDYATRLISKHQLDRLLNKDGRGRQYEIKLTTSGIRMTEV